ncbi:hypothetical protein Tco_0942929 [Tanacetum coccineum]
MRTRSKARRLLIIKLYYNQQQFLQILLELPLVTMADIILGRIAPGSHEDTMDAISFSDAWDRFKDLLRACPHHGFSELHQLDTFYNALNVNDQDSLNSAAGGNFLDKRPADCSSIIESTSKFDTPKQTIVSKVVVRDASTFWNISDVDELERHG